MVFIIIWKVAGELVNLKNMTVGSYRPLLVMKAAFHWSLFLMRTLLYPYSMSNLVNRVQSCKQSISCGMRGRGYWFLMVHKFTGL